MLMIRQSGLHNEPGDDEHGESDRDDREYCLRRGHDRSEPFEISHIIVSLKVRHNAEDTAARFGPDEGTRASKSIPPCTSGSDI